MQLGVMWLSFQCMYLSGEVVEPHNSKCQYSCPTAMPSNSVFIGILTTVEVIQTADFHVIQRFLCYPKISMLSKDFHVIQRFPCYPIGRLSSLSFHLHLSTLHWSLHDHPSDHTYLFPFTVFRVFDSVKTK